MSGERKRWVKVRHAQSGTFAKVTLQEGEAVGSWEVKTFTSGMAGGIREAYTGAEKALLACQEALRDIEGAS